VHLLEPGGHRGGLFAARRAARAHLAAPPALGGRAVEPPAARLLRGLRAVVRESPLDDSAAARLCALPPRLGAARLAIARDAWRRGDGARLRRSRRPAVRLESPDALASAGSSARRRRRAGAVLVRRHQVRLARYDDHER